MNLQEQEKKIKALVKRIAKCDRCSLAKTRTNTVPGKGSVDSKVMFIGEAPGKNEDLQGVPFIGRAGDIFDKLLNSINLNREQIYICNILKCRPPKNRNPSIEEMKSCVRHLDAQIKIINPQIIATLGNFSTKYVFEKFNLKYTTISQVKGRPTSISSSLGERIIMPLFHPAVAIYNQNRLQELKDDFKVIKKLLK
jgi:uracil-DNA glycosylase family 4